MKTNVAEQNFVILALIAPETDLSLAQVEATGLCDHGRHALGIAISLHSYMPKLVCTIYQSKKMCL